MNISALSLNDLQKSLSKGQLFLRSGDFVFCLQSKISSVLDGLQVMYADYPIELNSPFADFYISLQAPKNVRRWLRPQVQFFVDGYSPFKPLPFNQAFPMLEWGLNWCISTRINERLIIHAAVVEKNGKAMIMPGDSGNGKSTLCAALISRGWRLLSDELTMVSLDKGTLFPLPRPVSLKNESIDVIRSFNPDAVISRVARDTLKGTVAHMRVPAEHVHRSQESAVPALIVFPKYETAVATSLEKTTKGTAAISLIQNSFNFSVLAERGFQAVTQLIDRTDAYHLRYSSLEDVVARLDELLRSTSNDESICR